LDVSKYGIIAGEDPAIRQEMGQRRIKG